MTARERIESGERVLSLSEIADRLNQKRSNVAKYLARHGVEHAFPKAQGYFWWEADIERLEAERAADVGKMEADEKRRRAALARRDGKPPEGLGERQVLLLLALAERPRISSSRAEAEALRRLARRGFAGFVSDGNGSRIWRLTPAGYRLVGRL